MEPRENVVLLATPVAGPVEGRRPGRRSPSNDDLLGPALDLFLKNGFERTSIDASAAGMRACLASAVRPA